MAGLLIILILCVFIGVNGSVVLGNLIDETLTIQAVGEDVVDAVIKKLQCANIFPSDHGILKRIACVESRYGRDAGTFFPQNQRPYYGGIWQVDEAAFIDTQNYHAHPGLREFLHQVKDTLGIDWTHATWSDLWIPMYSGLAAEIMLKIKFLRHVEAPRSLKEQGEFWRLHYNLGIATGEVTDFISNVTHCEQATCMGRMDLTILLESSGAVTKENFDKCLTFIGHYVESFALVTARLADETGVRVELATFNNETSTVLARNYSLTVVDIKHLIQAVTQAPGPSQAGQAISATIRMFNGSDPERHGIAKVVAIFMTSTSQDDVIGPADDARRNGISILSVGIGEGVNKTALLQMAPHHPERVLHVANFDDDLSDSLHRLNHETCKVPQKARLGSMVMDKLAKGEKRYFHLENIPNNGVTVSVSAIEGGTDSFYSYSDDTPSSAVHDGIVADRKFIPHGAGVKSGQLGVCSTRVESADGSSAFISVTGLGDLNDYILEVTSSGIVLGGTFGLILVLTVLLYIPGSA